MRASDRSHTEIGHAVQVSPPGDVAVKLSFIMLMISGLLGAYNDPILCAICGVDYYSLFKDNCKNAYAVSA
jgi:hypothetical protein